MFRLPHIPRSAAFAAVTALFVAGAPIASAQNTNNGTNSTIAAGNLNTINAGSTNVAIVAGTQNLIDGGNNNFIGAGRSNTVLGLGGLNNISVIVAGFGNTNAAGRSVIVGGQRNLIGTNSRSSTITGGEFNVIQTVNPALGGVLVATIGGGQSNLVGSNGFGAVIGGGSLNTNRGEVATIGGGRFNFITNKSDASTISGGNFNRIAATNIIDGSAEYSAAATIGGGENNLIGSSADGATIGGGTGHEATGSGATIAGGVLNRARGIVTFVGGGNDNDVGGRGSFVGGGIGNRVGLLASNAVISGGFGNRLDTNVVNAALFQGAYSVVGGGEGNTGFGNHAVIGGGLSNQVKASFATVPGGRRCIADHEGTFVWGSSLSVDTKSTVANSFTVRAPNGVRFITTLATNNVGSPLATNSGGTNGVILTAGGTQWQSLSDSNSKTDFAAIEPREILSKLAALPVTSWQYKHDAKRRYIGPMSQDFHAAFGLGSDDKTIGTLDSDGVMYAAIQGLVAEIKLRDEKIAQLEAWSREQGARSQAEIQELKAKSTEVDELKAKLRAVEQRLNTLPPAP
jgi:hypothetical protein